MAKIVVIGAGVGGATAAALLAKAGHEVTLLEAHVYPGGCAGTFYHQKYRFDAGATLAGGFHEGGPHHVVGEQLGIAWQVQPVDPAWQTHLPDRVITQHAGREAWHEELGRAFADSPDRARIARDWGCPVGDIGFASSVAEGVAMLAERAGLLAPLQAFGGSLTVDTCILTSPMLPPEIKTIMTNSAKYAYYAPGMLKVGVVFGTVEECVWSAVAGRVIREEGRWHA